MSFFRSEPEEARASAWLGRVLLARPLSFSVFAGFAVAMALALGAYFIFGDYTRKARVQGALAPTEGVVRIVAQQPGRVEQLSIAEGDEVRGDALLLSVVDARASHSVYDVGAAISRRVSERQAALAQQREFILAALAAEQSGLGQRRAGMAREIEQLERELEGQRSRLTLAERGAARVLKLEEMGFVSPSAGDREREAALDQESRLEAMRRTRVALMRERGALDFEIATALARARAQLSALDVQRASVDQERLERDLQHRVAVVAPAPGIVATVLVEPGQTVSAGTTLATIIPQGAPLEAHLYAPSRSVGFVRPGQEVLLRYTSYPHQKFGSQRGRIASVSRHAMPPGDLGFVPADGSREPLYRIKVELAAQSIDAYGRQEPLKAGMQVEADILLDRRRLIEWVFEPLLSLSGRA
ncbi:MAG TPA: HlyD family efflux transporter periplasmic adaptor subunit [Usitatibacter sp.]|nr:HlyD family efflux transporter periplasmic adaptor subunit [Usitatibacter sp.]